MKPKLIVILGPNACGKTALSIKLAKKYGGEIISADSRQVYTGMNIGTGKVTKKEMAGIPHHLLDVASPKTRFTVAHFRQKAGKAIKQIRAKNKVPFIVGGTGFYIQSVTENRELPRVKPDEKLRARLEKKSAAELFGQLKKLDSARAKNIDRQNKRRLIRALEIVIKSGQPVPAVKTKKPFDILYLGITFPMEIIRQRIALRLDKRLRQGMLAEAKKLRHSGVSWKKLDEFGLEYRWMARYLRNKISRQEMAEKLQKDIEHYAKRQMTWFKRNKSIHWIKNYREAEKLVKKFLQ